MSIDKLLRKAIEKHENLEYEEAGKLYRKILSTKPRHLDANYLLGTLYSECGDYEKAKQHLARASLINPNSPMVQVNLGKTTEVNITLDVFTPTPTTEKPPNPVTGMVRVYVDRTGSTICIDNAHCVNNVGGSPGPGTGTTFFNDVAVNETHIVTVAAEGYQPFSATVSVEKDLIAKVDVSLEPIVGRTTVPTTTSPPVTTVPVTTVPPATTTPLPTLPVQTRSGLDAVPVLGALALCGLVFLAKKGRD